MSYALAALFFALAFVGACTVLHVTVRAYWPQIVAALRGQHGLAVSRAVAPRSVAQPRQRAAA